MALAAVDDERAVERAAPAGLDGIAERFDVARLAEDAVIEGLAALGRPLQQLDRAVNRDAFLVAGDQKRERAVFRLAAVGAEIIESGRDEAGDAALHVDRAAAVNLVVRDLAAKGRMLPGRLVARRHDVGMTGEHQIGLFAADARIEVFDRRRAGLGKRHAMHRKAGFRQHILQIGERAAFLRRHRAAADKIARNGDGIGRHRRLNLGQRIGAVLVGADRAAAETKLDEQRRARTP